MKVTIDGWRLAPSVLDGSIHSGAKPTIKVAHSPKVVWNGNPYCELGTVLYLPGYPGTGNTIYDFSGQGNNGTITNATWKRLPSGLWYLDFNGANAIVALGDDIFTEADFATGATIGCWFKADTVDDAFQYLMSFEDRMILRIVATTDLLNFFIYDGASQHAISDGAIIPGTWYCAYGTWDSTPLLTPNMVLYLGSTSAPVAQAITDTATIPIFDTASRPNAIGSNRTGGDKFDGGVVLPRVFNRALTASEIGTIFNQERHLFGV